MTTATAIRCTAPHHPDTCAATVVVWPESQISTPSCSTVDEKCRALYGAGWLEDARIEPWPAGRPMWVWDEDQRRAYYIDPVTREEVQAP